jgi:WD40 repeat protein
MRVWVKRDSGQYWPTICQIYQAAASALEYDSNSQRLFVGLGSGLLHEYKLSGDLNRIDPKRTYSAHGGRITALQFVPQMDWILSVSRDKTFQWCCTKTGRKLGSFEAQAWCMDIAYDHTSSYVFVADYSGQINVLKLESQGFQFVTTLKGHQSSVRSLAYDQERRVLFSGGYDQIIVVWDIGSQKGTAYELTGHKAKLTDLCFSPQVKRLLSSSERGNVGIWDLDIQREETAEWGGGSTCEKCGIPFFWNVKDMWTRKIIGVRQHHCRKCGRAVCGKCSEQESTFPLMGFEIPVRMCQDCHATVTTDDRTPLATFLEFKSDVTDMDLDEDRWIWITVGSDKIIKVWDIKSTLCP